MRFIGRQNEAEFSKLQARYRAAWRCFSVAVHHWQTLQAEGGEETSPLRAAETAVRVAEEQYRQARNALADSLLERSCREPEALLVGSR